MTALLWYRLPPLDAQRTAPRPMRTRSGAAAADQSAVGGAPLLPPLPNSVVHAILLRVPPRERLCLSAVSRRWRAAVRDPALWSSVDLSLQRHAGAVTDALLAAVSRAAAGGMASLDVSGRTHGGALDAAPPALSPATLAAVLAANAGSLRHLAALRADRDECPLDEIVATVAVLPRLFTFAADVVVSVAQAAELLINAHPFGPLRLRRLRVFWPPPEPGAPPRAHDPDDLPALARHISRHASLKELKLQLAPAGEAEALRAVTHCVLSSRLTALYLERCGLCPASLPPLAAMLRDTACVLTTLDVTNAGGAPLLARRPAAAAAAAASFCDALRANARLVSVRFAFCGLWEGDPGAGCSLVRALVAHPSVRHIELQDNRRGEDDAPEIGDALGELVASNAEQLASLDLSWCRFRDADLAGVFASLRANTRLRSLCCVYNSISPAFAGQVLRCVRANTALRFLQVNAGTGLPALLEAEALVDARAAAAAAAALDGGE